MSPIALMSTSLRLALASWRGQLAVLGCGAVLLGLTLLGASDGGYLPLRAAVAMVTWLLLVAMSLRAALATVEEYLWQDTVAELGEGLTLLPRLLAQGGFAALPAIISCALTMLVAGPMPLLALLLVPIAFVVVGVTLAPVLLSVAAVVHGDMRWVPATAFGVTRAQPWRLALATIVGLSAAAMAAVPLVLAGIVLGALNDWIGVLASGLAASSLVPWLGCGALAMWRASGSAVDAGAAAAEEFDVAQVATAFGSLQPQWVDGPSWDTALEPGATWGTWIRLEAAANVALRVAWSGIAAPDVQLCTEAGVWWSPGVPARSGAAVPVQLPAGNTYVQLGARDAAAQALTLTLLVAAAQAA
jgi:hypothetical protein